MSPDLPIGHSLDYLLWWIAFTSLLIHTWCFFRLFPTNRRPRLRLVAGNVLVFACMIAAAALVAETYLRFLYMGTDSHSVTLTARKWELIHVRRNSVYCRDTEWTPQKPPGVRRIAFVGDSVTYGAGIERVDDRFSNRVQARLDRRSPGAVEILNVAWPGWHTQDQLDYAIARIIPMYDVDEVVLYYFPNDIEPLLPVTEDDNPIRRARCTWTNTDSSFLLDFLYYRVYSRTGEKARRYFGWIANGYDDERLWAQQQRRLGELIVRCGELGVTLRVALLPFNRSCGDRYQPAVVHGLLRRFFEVNDIDVVDLLPTVAQRDPADLVVSRHDYHPNETAHELYAEAIWNAFYAEGR